MRLLIRVLALSAIDVWALVALRPDLSNLAEHLTRPRHWMQRVGPDAAAVELSGALVWALSLWLAIGLLAVLISRGPGAMGSVGDRVARTVLPRSIHRLLAGAAGFSILLTPVAASALEVPAPPSAQAGGAHMLASRPAPTLPTAPATVTTPTAPPAASGTSRPPIPAPTWPTAPTLPTAPSSATTPTAQPAPSGTSRPPIPAPTWPTAPTAPTVPTVPTVPNTPTAPTAPTAPRTPTRSTEPARTTTPAAQQRVVVHPGDSLWLIAAARLGPHASASAIAGQWPRWYAANRPTIGPDPDLLIPGQVLHAPDRGAA